MGVEQKPWLIDVATGQQTLLSAYGREPLISPDGRFEHYPAGWVWHSETELDVQIQPTCAFPEDLEEARRPGIYRLNLETFQAVRLGDLPPD